MTPCCIRVTRAQDRWQLVSSSVQSDQQLDTVQLVTQAPEFLGMLNPKQGVPRAAMVAPNSSSGRVVIAIDDKGGIQLAACPERADEGKLSALIGDLLATGGRFWHQGYESVAKPFEDKLGKPLADLVGARVGKDWSQDSFRAGVERSLKQGRFPIVVIARELNKALEDMLDYLENMNLKVKPLGLEHSSNNGVEIIRPRLLGKEARAAARAATGYREEPTPVVTISTVKREDKGLDQYEPLTNEKATEKQQEILARLVRLDDLGLVRRGLEYLLPGDELKETSEGTIVVTVDPDRWPSPKPEEVIVVVKTGMGHLANYLALSPEEVEEFLSSLPRVQRKEHKGCLLLRAASIYEAGQLVNELKALKEVAQTGV